jgi:hypothetical protein
MITNEKCEAEFEGIPFMTDKGIITTKSLIAANIS